MENEGRRDQTEAGDPFSVFGELVNIRSENRYGLHLFQSKLKELIFEVTTTKTIENGVDEAGKKLIKEAVEIYIKNTQRRLRAHNLINAVREARNRQG